MQVTVAVASDLEKAVSCLAASFAEDPITGFLLQAGPHYHDRLVRFFSLLMRARLALKMPVLVARDAAGIQGAAMGYTATPPSWPQELAEDWTRFEAATPGLVERMAVYDAIALKYKPSTPYYYLGVIGVEPGMQGRGVGMRLLRTFCDLSARDPASSGVYLETAKPSNVGFYERLGFVETGRGSLGDATLWCMFKRHD